MISVDRARDFILKTPVPIASELVHLEMARDRFLVQEIFADEDQPAFNRSAMDGYAFSTLNLGEFPNGYRVVATSLPGTDFTQLPALNPDHCYRIFTGSPLPGQVCRVVPQEQVSVENGIVTLSADIRELGDGPAYLRFKGEDVKKGALLIPPGSLLGPVELSVMASVGITEVQVARKPSVIHITTGDELIEPVAVPGPGQIRDSNGPLIRALVEQAGGTVQGQFKVGDHPEEIINAALSCGSEPDLLLISGGASVGEHDHTATVLETLGYDIQFKGVDVRPGKPLIFATKGSRVAFGIPGNPVSHFVVFHLFIKPLLLKMAGAASLNPWKEGHLCESLVEGVKNARETYWPATASLEKGQVNLRPLVWRSSGHLASLLGVNALMKIPPNSISFPPGTLFTWFEVN